MFGFYSLYPLYDLLLFFLKNLFVSCLICLYTHCCWLCTIVRSVRATIVATSENLIERFLSGEFAYTFWLDHCESFSPACYCCTQIFIEWVYRSVCFLTWHKNTKCDSRATKSQQQRTKNEIFFNWQWIRIQVVEKKATAATTINNDWTNWNQVLFRKWQWNYFFSWFYRLLFHFAIVSTVPGSVYLPFFSVSFIYWLGWYVVFVVVFLAHR